MIQNMKNATRADRFWEKVAIRPAACWKWTGQQGHCGYGRLEERRGHCRKVIYAHRVSWEIHFGAIPKGKHVLHRCDNPSCVNPAHLFLGDQRTNNADKIAKNRQAKGIRFPRAKLNDAAVIEIWRLNKIEKQTQQSIADRFGVSISQINFVLKRRTWKHVPLPEFE